MSLPPCLPKRLPKRLPDSLPKSPPASPPDSQSAQITVLATVRVAIDQDVSRLRRAVANQADTLGFSAFDRTRLITATSELARNMLTYAGGGVARVERLDEPTRTALRVAFDDLGPGIDDLDQALADGYTTGLGLGLGLGGAKRLVDDFTIDSGTGQGTRVAIARWLRPPSDERRALRR